MTDRQTNRISTCRLDPSGRRGRVKKDPHLIWVGKLGKLNHIRKVCQGQLGKNRQIRNFFSAKQENNTKLGFFGKLGNFWSNQESSVKELGNFGKFGKWVNLIRKNNRILGKLTPNIRKVWGETKKKKKKEKKKKKVLTDFWVENQESWEG